MTDKNESPDALQQRINQLKSSVGDGDKPESYLAEGMGLGLRFGVELAAGLIVGGGLGYAIDHWLHTKPAFFIICLLLGVAGSFRNIVREANRSEEKNDKD
jgi:ATP synthase protein I